MPSRTAFLVLLGTLLLAPLPGSTQVAPTPGSTLKAALDAAERGAYDASQYPDLSRDPAYGWLEYAVLVRSIDTLPSAQAQAFLTRYSGQPVAEAFRELWLAATARREDWPA